MTARRILLVTDGYRDLLDMGRLDRPYSHQFDPNWIRPHQLNPIVPRRRRKNIREFQETEIIIAPTIKTEGKVFQTVQGVGMGSK